VAVREGNVNPGNSFVALPNWTPESTHGKLAVPASSVNSITVPSGARAVLFTANVDCLVGLSSGLPTAASDSGGILLKSGDLWPATVLPVSTQKFTLRGTGTGGTANFQFLTFRSAGT
jgi:hypothetical protein